MDCECVQVLPWGKYNIPVHHFNLIITIVVNENINRYCILRELKKLQILVTNLKTRVE